MAFEVFKLVHEKEITDILWKEDREAFIRMSRTPVSLAMG